jgi:hypothetical protein
MTTGGHPFFMWKGKKINNVEKLYRAAKKCQDKEEASKFIEAAVASGTPRNVVLSNIGYMTGYEDQASLDLIIKLFDTVHPIFGKRLPEPEAAFTLGLLIGEARSKIAKGEA